MKIVAFPFVDVFVSPIGKMVIKATKSHIHQIYFDDEFSSTIKESTLIKKTKQQLTEYFDAKRLSFDLPLTQEGTDFQHQVWEQLLQIPFGQTWSYLELALKFNDENLKGITGEEKEKKVIKEHYWVDMLQSTYDISNDFINVQWKIEAQTEEIENVE